MFFTTPHPIRELLNFFHRFILMDPPMQFRFALIFPLKVTKKQASYEFTRASVTCFDLSMSNEIRINQLLTIWCELLLYFK